MNAQLDLAPFDTDDRIALNNFLASRTGQRMLTRLTSEAPTLLRKGDTNEILIRNGEAVGYVTAINNLVALTSEEGPPVQQLEQMYPAPEDDKHWTDGKTTDPAK